MIEAIQTEVDEMEDQVLTRELTRAEIERLYLIRRDLLRLRNAAVPLVEVCRKLEHAEAVAIDTACGRSFAT